MRADKYRQQAEFDPEEPDLHTRLMIIEERQQRQALAMQYLAEAVDRLIDENKRLRRGQP